MNSLSIEIHQLLLDKGLAFARYSLPGELQDQTIVSFEAHSFMHLDGLNDKQKEGFLFAPFQEDENNLSWFLPADKILRTDSDFLQMIGFLSSLPDVQVRLKKSPLTTSKNEYAQTFDLYHQALKNHKLDKAILSKVIRKERGEEALSQIYNRLLQAYPDAFVYWIHLPHGEIWMGATPEILLRQDEKEVQTMALAGTQKMNHREVSEITWDEKEIEEQAYVKNYVRGLLISSAYNFSISQTHNLQAGNLVHLCTNFSVDQVLTRAEAFSLTEKLHPTPAVCGIPLEASKALILEKESHSRKYYTGFLGPVGKNKMDLFVNLRCMQVYPRDFVLYVGGGITRDSEMEKEWQETEAKAQTLLSVIS
jgi:isochorismate synthase